MVGIRGIRRDEWEGISRWMGSCRGPRDGAEWSRERGVALPYPQHFPLVQDTADPILHLQQPLDRSVTVPSPRRNLRLPLTLKR